LTENFNSPERNWEIFRTEEGAAAFLARHKHTTNGAAYYDFNTEEEKASGKGSKGCAHSR
jgi:hypothetical protein